MEVGMLRWVERAGGICWNGGSEQRWILSTLGKSLDGDESCGKLHIQ